MDRAGRARRLAIALAIGTAVAVAAYFITMAIAQPETIARTHDATMGDVPYAHAWRFVFGLTALAGALAFGVSLMLQDRRR